MQGCVWVGQGKVGMGGNVAGQQKEEEENEVFFLPVSESNAAHKKKSGPPTLSLRLFVEVCLPP